MTTTPAIVIVAYKRTHALQRLLSSVANAVYTDSNIPLIISIDYSGDEGVLALCENFSWQHGEKRIISHPQNLGLKNHIIQCCLLSDTYGAVIVLEDDLVVSAYYYAYAQQALEQYKNDTNLAGISLYSYAVTENGFVPFYPLADGNSTYFMQLPSSWGQLFTAMQWKSFMQWYIEHDSIPEQNTLPQYANDWGSKSWKKHYLHYMIENGKYFVFPKQSYSTNFGDPGTNTDRQGLFQVQLMQSATDFKYVSLNESNAIYDAWFELVPNSLSKLTPLLQNYEYSVDLYGTKELHRISTPYLLSSKKCSSPIFSFGNAMPDVTQNITAAVEGSFFSLGKTESFIDTAFDPINFYVNVSPVKEVIVDKYISKKFNEYVSNKEYKEAYPLVNFIVLNNKQAGIDKTAQSINSIKYPNDRVLLTTVSSLGNEIWQDENSSYFVMLNSGDTVQAELLSEAIAIMKKYPDVNWITFTTESNLPLQRWNSRLHTLSLAKKSARKISNMLTVFNRQALMSVGSLQSISAIEAMWSLLFSTQQLYTCISKQVVASDTPAELLETSLPDKLWEQLMIADTKYLRSYYKNKQGFPAIVRQTHEGTYYLSEY